MSISVQQLTQEDRADWERLYHGYAEFYKVPMNGEILDTVWSWIFDEANPFYCLCARNENGVLTGIMHYREMPSPLRGKKVGFLDDLFVDPACRGQGIVGALFDALKEECKKHNWPLIRWITAEDNYRGRAVYDRLSDKTHWVTYQIDI